MTDNSVSAFERNVRDRLKDAETFGKVEDNEVLLIEIGVLRGLIKDIEMWRDISGRDFEIREVEPQEIVLADKTDEQIKAEVARLMTENNMLFGILRDDITKWGFDALVMMAKRILDEIYPETVFTGESINADVIARTLIEHLNIKRTVQGGTQFETKKAAEAIVKLLHSNSGPRFVVMLRQLVAEIEKT